MKRYLHTQRVKHPYKAASSDTVLTGAYRRAWRVLQVVGWGYDEFGELTEELRMASMPIVSEQTCLRSYPEFYSRFSNERTFCAGYKNGTSACNGDSGGGLVVARGAGAAKTWVLRGLVSVSVSRDDHRVCNTQHYVVFTDLAKHRDWIANYVR
ncbi:Trypsin eta [Gryllus bimaculatus]|nr:Trypsin eta [Gryllus bimaculatus]